MHEGMVYENLQVRQGALQAAASCPRHLYCCSREDTSSRMWSMVFVRSLLLLQGDPGIPELKWFGEYDGHVFLVTSLLGPSLESLFERCGRQFSLKTVVMLADEMLVRVQSIHSRGYLHGDVKPDNFVIGRKTEQDAEAARRIYTLDFGLSQSYWNRADNAHAKFSADEPFTGTRRYASVAAHLGYRQSRRDDLESIGYCLLYLLRGRLPWQGLGGDAESDTDPVLRCKTTMSMEELCEGVPVQFRMYLQYCRGLRYEELPKYDYLRALFTSVADDYHIEYDFEYDWITPEDAAGKSVSGTTVREGDREVAATSGNREPFTPPNRSISVSPESALAAPMQHWDDNGSASGRT